MHFCPTPTNHLKRTNFTDSPTPSCPPPPPQRCVGEHSNFPPVPPSPVELRPESQTLRSVCKGSWTTDVKSETPRGPGTDPSETPGLLSCYE